MSTTNPPPGSDPVHALAPKQPGSPPADESTSGAPAPEVIKRGYEEDVYDSRSVISVPLMVILFFVLAFGTVSIIFAFMRTADPDPNAHPAASERNKAPLNDRLKRYKRGGEVNQPGLEPARQRAGDARAMPQPELPGVNSPEIHPEDLRATKDRYPDLFKTEPGRLGLDQAMQLSDSDLRALFPAKDGPGAIHSEHLPTAANAGRGAADSTAKPPPLPPLPAGGGK
ncbi:MAG: hypothetical protein L0241_02805 [Planctomycetia bacterium]|nr:hypothetical protein [Planctomycetia bacterium]